MLCGPCLTKWHSCLDLRSPFPPVRLITIGRDRPQDMEAFRQRRAAEWAEVVRGYGKQLTQDCAAGRHAGTGEGPP